MIKLMLVPALILAACTPAQEERFDANLARAARYCTRIEIAAPLLKPIMVVSGVPADIVLKGEAQIAAYCFAIKAVAVPVTPVVAPESTPLVPAR